MYNVPINEWAHKHVERYRHATRSYMNPAVTDYKYEHEINDWLGISYGTLYNVCKFNKINLGCADPISCQTNNNAQV
jgi:hypothetical protein